MKGKKTGGRQPGSQNKATIWGKKVITSLLEEYINSGLMDSDFQALEPRDRLTITEKLMQYTLPKMQSTAMDVSVEDGKKSLEDRLIELSKPAEE